MSNEQTLNQFADKKTIKNHKAYWEEIKYKMDCLNGKNTAMELRLMYLDLEMAECLRQMQNCIDVYNHDCSGIEWLAGILNRELQKFEKVERKRLSLAEKKLQLICLGLMTQVLERLEHLDLQFQQEHAKNVESQELTTLGNEYWALETNLKYFLDYVEPFVLRLNFLDGLSKPYKSEKALEKCMIKASCLRTCH